MKFERVNEAVQQAHYRYTNGELHISVTPSPSEPGRQWCYFDLPFGIHSDESPEECCKLWPRMVVEKLREVADQLEAKLEAEQ